MRIRQIRSHAVRLGCVVAAVWLLAVSRTGLGAQAGRTDAVPGRPVPQLAQAAPGAPPATPSLLSATRAAAFAGAAASHLDYLPGEVLITFKDGTTVAGQARALEGLRSQPLPSQLRWAGPVAVLDDPTQPDARILVAQLMLQPEVASAQPNYIMRIPHGRRVVSTPAVRLGAAVAPVVSPAFTPNDQYFGLQWNFTAIDVPSAWDINKGGSTALIAAIVDTGLTTFNGTLPMKSWNGTAIQTFNAAFSSDPDISTSRIVAPMDFTGATPSSLVLDTDGHGTHVTSTIGEDTNNSLGVAGIAFNVKLMPVKACVSYWDVQFAWSAAGNPGFVPDDSGDACADSDLITAIHYAADNGAKVLNFSIGGTDPDPALQAAIQYAVGKGVFVSIAGGNDYQNGNPTEYPAFYANGLDGAMSVGAVGKTLTRSYYSSTGSYIEIAAPGGDDQNPGTQAGQFQDFGFVWQSTLCFDDQDPGLVFPRFDEYCLVGYEGTSMATPHVTGTAALIMSQGVTLPGAVELLIEKTAHACAPGQGCNASNATGRNDEYGFGLVQPRAALHGFGLGGGH